jgi:hypothetical protein
MLLEKKTAIDRIEVINSGLVLIHITTAIVENGNEISTIIGRQDIAPGNDYSTEDALVRAICAAVHTTEVVAAYQSEQARIAAQGG